MRCAGVGSAVRTGVPVPVCPRNIYKGSTFARHAGAGVNNNPAIRTETMEEERRLIYRVLRHWTEIARGGRLPRRDEINSYIRGDDAANCLLIAVRSPVERSHFVTVGVSLAVALCPTNTLAGMLLSRLSRVVLARCGLTFEGVATLSGVDILHRSALLPLSEDGVTIDHVLGAVSYHPLPAEEALTPQVISQTHWF